jgi:predicted AAA+ superfamily ATPase
MGYLSNRFGELAEHLVAPNIHKRFNELGYHFDAVAPGGYVIRDDNDKVKAEVDILLENAEYLMAVEVKAKVHLKDIEHHIKRIEILREYRNKRSDRRKIQGAIAGAIFGNTEKQAAFAAGFYIIEQTGDTVKITIPEGFKVRDW